MSVIPVERDGKVVARRVACDFCPADEEVDVNVGLELWAIANSWILEHVERGTVVFCPGCGRIRAIVVHELTRRLRKLTGGILACLKP